MYDSATHLPLIIKLANGREAGKTVEAQVRSVDGARDMLETSLKSLLG